jgi:hypothetical protein
VGTRAAGHDGAAHAAGARVTVNPKYPRRRVAQVVNQVIAGMCPPLFGVLTGTVQAQLVAHVGVRAARWHAALYKAEYRPFNASVYDWRPLRTAFIKRDSGFPGAARR